MSGRSVAFTVAAIVLAALFIAPLFRALASSVKTPPEAAAIPPTWLPSSVSFKN
jgi:ABC-type glycerol-3-phosphate transport system permease component